jgi:hypothetical protein
LWVPHITKLENGSETSHLPSNIQVIFNLVVMHVTNFPCHIPTVETGKGFRYPDCSYRILLDICRIKTYKTNKKNPQKKLAPTSSLIYSQMDWTDVLYWVTVGKYFAALQ